MIPPEILETIIIFSIFGIFIMLTILIYPYIKKGVYPYIKKEIYPHIKKWVYPSIKWVYHYIKNIPYLFLKRNSIDKDKSPNLNSNIKHRKNRNTSSISPNHQNIRFENLNKDKTKKEKNNNINSNKIENKDIELNNENEISSINNENEISSVDNENEVSSINNENEISSVDNENHSFVAKSWNEPMSGNHKEIVNNFKENNEQTKKYKNPLPEKTEPEISFLTNNEPTLTNSKLNNELLNEDKNNNLKNRLDNGNLEKTGNSLNTKNLKEAKNSNTNELKRKTDHKINKKNDYDDDLSILYDNKLGKISAGKHVIFNYNNESYLSEILEIKHDNIKVIYRGNYKWIQLSNIKKML
jgi:hypothetical protein